MGLHHHLLAVAAGLMLALLLAHIFILKRETPFPQRLSSCSEPVGQDGPAHLDGVARNFGLWLAGSAAAFAAAFLAVILIIDPYGISPIGWTISGVNQTRPARANIDRQTKPVEVFFRQPRTVFLGTSRIHQSINPRSLDGTAFAPAFNSAVPGANFAENVALLEQFAEIAPSMKTAIVEIFPYAYLAELPPLPAKGLSAVASDVRNMLFSGDAALAAIRTIAASRDPASPSGATHRDGYWIQPASWVPGHHFTAQNYANFVIDATAAVPDFAPRPSALASLDRMQAIADARGIRLIFVFAPSHAWDDYRLISLDRWGLIETVYRHAASLREVYSFAQANAVTTEGSSDAMRFWYDPLHFNLTVGDMMLAAIDGRTQGLPPNFIRRVDRASVEAVLQERRSGVMAWATTESHFAETFDMIRDLKARTTPLDGRLDLNAATLTIDGRVYPITSGEGRVETAIPGPSGIRISGWAVDETGRHVNHVVMTAGGRPVKKWFPTTPRVDIEVKLGQVARPQGFWFDAPRPDGELRVFALTRNGRALRLKSAVPQVAD